MGDRALATQCGGTMSPRNLGAGSGSGSVAEVKQNGEIKPEMPLVHTLKPRYVNTPQSIAKLVTTVDTIQFQVASFPGPAQLFVACSTEKWGEPGMFHHVSIT